MDTGEVKRGRGRPVGTPGGGKYGCTTKVVRVPAKIADNIPEILASFEAIKGLVDDWELLNKLLNEGGLIIKCERKIKNKGNAVY